MSNLRTICRLNDAVYSSLTCCYNQARCRPRLIVSLSNLIQNPNFLNPRLIDLLNVKKMETSLCGGFRNYQRRMLAGAANWTDEKSPYDTHGIAKNMQLDKQIAADIEEVESNNSEIININKMDVDIVCLDGIRINGKHINSETRLIQACYKHGRKYVRVNTNSKIINKVELFCVERWKIHNDYAHDETLVRHKLNQFNSNFRQTNQIHALPLMKAAFELEITSLVDLMMDDVIDIFAKMTEDEAYEILYVNLRNNFSHDDFKKLSKRVKLNRWAFEGL